MEMIRYLWHPLLEILLEKVLQLAGKFDTCGTTSNDNLYDFSIPLSETLLLRLPYVTDAFVLRPIDL